MKRARRERVYNTLSGQRTDRFGRALNVFFIALICLNVLAVILETDKAIRDPNRLVFYSFLLFSTIVFTIDTLAALGLYSRGALSGPDFRKSSLCAHAPSRH